MLSSEAIVLRSFDFSESDRIVVFFSREYGKLRVFAGGAKKIKNRLAGAFLHLTHCYLTFYRKSEWVRIDQCEIIDPHPLFYQDMERFFRGAYLGELVDLSLEEGEVSQELFVLFRFFLKTIELGRGDPESILRIFEIRLLELLGLFPILTACASCGEKIIAEMETRTRVGVNNKFSFSVSAGGLLCRGCAGKGNYPAMSIGNINFCNQVLKSELDRLVRLRLSLKQQAELKPLLNRYLEKVLEREIKSFSFLACC